jgi:hypothetical protein
MRIARLAAAGLALGVIVGFAIALLRPRTHARIGEPGHPSLLVLDEAPRNASRTGDTPRWAEARVAEAPVEPAKPAPEQVSILDVRARRRVTG